MTGPARQTTTALRQARGREGVRQHRRTLERRRQILRLGGLCLVCALAGSVTGALVGSLGWGARIPSSRIAILITEPGPESIAADYPPPAETAASPDASPDAVSEADPGPTPGTERSDAPVPPHSSESQDAELARQHEQGLTADPSIDGTEALGAVDSDRATPNETEPKTRLAMPTLAEPGRPETRPDRPPLWQRHAVAIADPGGRPMVAIVLDDLGLNRPGAERAIALPGPLSLAFMTYAEGLDRFAAAAQEAGHELLLHVPMEPVSAGFDPGPRVLSADLSDEELMARMQWGLDRFEGFVGINNHMGSKFTADSRGMRLVMDELRRRGLLYLDSVTSSRSVGAETAGRIGVPFAERDVFLDNDWTDREAIRGQLAELESIARRRGYAVGIGHPHPATLEVLAEWLPEARGRGLALVPMSAIVRHRIGVAQKTVSPAG